MWQVVVVVCTINGGAALNCDRAQFRAPYATFEECADAARKLSHSAAMAASAFLASRGERRQARVTTRCAVPPGAA